MVIWVDPGHLPMPVESESPTIAELTQVSSTFSFENFLYVSKLKRLEVRVGIR